MTMKHISANFRRLDAIRYAYESPPEESLGERIADSLAPNVQLKTQVWVDTAAGPFRLDLLLTQQSGRRIAIEVDGREFHEPSRDRWRTVFILCSGTAHVVYRVSASMVYTNLIGVLAGLTNVEPSFFDPDLVSRWKKIARDRWQENSSPADSLDYENDEISDGDLSGRWSDREGWRSSSRAFAVSFHNDLNDCNGPAFWPYIEFAKRTGLRDINQLDKLWQERIREQQDAYSSERANSANGIFEGTFYRWS